MLRLISAAALGLALAACANDGRIARDAAFDATASGAVVIVGVRLVEPRYENHGIAFVGYDAAADRTELLGMPGFLAEFSYSTPLDAIRVDDTDYFVRKLPPGHYFLSNTVASTWREGFFSLAIASESRTAMNVHCSMNGLTNVNFETPISSLSVPRFELRAGRIYYLGDYQLDGGGRVSALPSDPERAAKALASYANLQGAVEPARLLVRPSLTLPNVIHERCE